MSRVQISLPEGFAFTTEIPLYIGHINYGGHLDNALLLTIVSEARVRYFKSLGYTELDNEGVGLVMADAAVQYKSEAFHGEIMMVAISPANLHGKGFDLVWRMSEKASGREVARGKSGMLFFDYRQRKVAAVPPGFLLRVGEKQRRRRASAVPQRLTFGGFAGLGRCATIQVLGAAFASRCCT